MSYVICVCLNLVIRDCRGRDRMVVGFTTNIGYTRHKTKTKIKTHTKKTTTQYVLDITICLFV
jgi:hypothetical protein